MTDSWQTHNDIQLDHRPSLLTDLLLNDDDGDDVSFTDGMLEHFEKQRELEDASAMTVESLATSDDGEDGNDSTNATNDSGSSKSRRKRSVKAQKPCYFDSNGEICYLTPKKTSWCFLHVKHPPLGDQKFEAKFRRRFRMPYGEFTKLLAKVKSDGSFRRWMSKDAVGKESSPIELLLLGSLRYLGRGLTFDDLEEHTATNEETHRQFFHVFITFGRDYLYPLCVTMPTTKEQCNAHRHEFDIGGLAGAGYSTDGTHVIMWNCAHNLKQANTGFKQSHPTRSFNVSCNHRKQMLYSTDGHPGRWNDKTLAIMDVFICGTHEGKILQDVTFELAEWSDGVGSDVQHQKHRGAWGISDNGYHRWTCMQAPAKTNSLIIEQRLSDWIESFRKDIECTFGILKGRFRILKTGIRAEGIETVNKIWLTCCALHNMLLEVDGLNEEWQGGVEVLSRQQQRRQSDYLGELGENAPEHMRMFAPFAVDRMSETELRDFGSEEHRRSSHQMPEELLVPPEELMMAVDDEEDAIETDEDGAIKVNSMSYNTFRSRLAHHFDVLHRSNQIKWPTK